MKIKPEHHQVLSIAINAVHSQELLDKYTKAGLSGERYRWDMLHISRIEGKSGTSWVCDNLYPYLNDRHVDTALRRIIGRWGTS